MKNCFNKNIDIKYDIMDCKDKELKDLYIKSNKDPYYLEIYNYVYNQIGEFRFKRIGIFGFLNIMRKVFWKCITDHNNYVYQDFRNFFYIMNDYRGGKGDLVRLVCEITKVWYRDSKNSALRLDQASCFIAKYYQFVITNARVEVDNKKGNVVVWPVKYIRNGEEVKLGFSLEDCINKYNGNDK